jgi:nitroreductase/GNAT superfamily N-acetyltransferase
MTRDILFVTPHHVLTRLHDPDRPTVQALLERCVDYFELVDGAPPGDHAADGLWIDVAPGKTLDDKLLLGVWDLSGHLDGVLDVMRDYPEPGEWFIGLLLIDPAERGQGTGGAVYRAFAAWAAGCGATAIGLGVVEANTGAYRFWLRLGFEAVRVTPPRTFGSREQTVTVMRQPLTPDILATIFKRRSIRHYTGQPVERDTLVRLLQAAMAAPTACNSQPWEFIVVTDPARLDRLREKLQFARYNAPAAIVVCGNTGIANNSTARHYWVQDCCAATENILIAAAGLGLGTVWIGLYPLPGAMKPVYQVLNIPDSVTPLCMVYVGYPAEGKAPRTQYDERRVYWEEYEPRKKRAKIKNAKYLE